MMLSDLSPSGKSLLLIRTGALGDLVHASATARWLLDENPDLKLHWLCSPVFFPVIQAVDARIQVWPWHRSFARQLALALWLATLPLAGCVNWQPSVKSGLQLWGLNAFRRLRHGAEPAPVARYRKQKPAVTGALAREQSREQSREQCRIHAVENFFMPLASASFVSQVLSEASYDAMKVEQSGPQGLPRLVPKLGAPEIALSALPAPAQIVLIPGVGGKRPNRAWPASAWLGLIQSLLTHTNARLAILGGPEETALVSQLMAGVANISGLERVVGIPGTLSLPEMMAYLSHTQVVVGGDTGPVHVAAALGCRIVGLYAPTSVARTGPRGPMQAQIITLTPPEALACWPCERKTCTSNESLPSGGDATACIANISPERVLEAVMLLINGI
ncbi:MAG: glycosyltransferase family 9 protein [Vampirovibrionales bacterium]|nr:glycosyltransferase family 9 protein [Vampirovibrionales bacterium]